jgi:hypothetical protein
MACTNVVWLEQTERNMYTHPILLCTQLRNKMFCPSTALLCLAPVHCGKVTLSVLDMTVSSEPHALYNIWHLFNAAAIRVSVKP